MKRLSIFLLPLLLAGCAQKVPVPSQYDYATLKYDTTTSKADVIADLGVPTRTIKVSDTQTAVSVQRVPSGHNLIHPTKWCPPNK